MPYLIYTPEAPSNITPLFSTRNTDSPVYAISSPDFINKMIVRDLRSWGWRVVEHKAEDDAWQAMLQKYSLCMANHHMGMDIDGRLEEREAGRVPTLWQVWKNESIERIMGERRQEDSVERAAEREPARLVKQKRDAGVERRVQPRGGDDKVERGIVPWIRQQLPCMQKVTRSGISLPIIEEDGDPSQQAGILVTRTITILNEQNIGFAARVNVNDKSAIWPVAEPPARTKFGHDSVECGEEDWTSKITCSGAGGFERVLARIGPAMPGTGEEIDKAAFKEGGVKQGKILPGCTLEEI
ncbi:hypothetical protein CC80DRAFT_317016 [Byssothecium circinans]|uniref:Uncharacterized protein n=1 Tax=Byssothecium circinans TaxID=147558 RepID=A0A6A5T9H7_9PLEO|nr:hypothetical protein CC80DRAFT_317016 [Byssothecium circinans]